MTSPFAHHAGGEGGTRRQLRLLLCVRVGSAEQAPPPGSHVGRNAPLPPGTGAVEGEETRLCCWFAQVNKKHAPCQKTQTNHPHTVWHSCSKSALSLCISLPPSLSPPIRLSISNAYMQKCWQSGSLTPNRPTDQRHRLQARREASFPSGLRLRPFLWSDKWLIRQITALDQSLSANTRPRRVQELKRIDTLLSLASTRPVRTFGRLRGEATTTPLGRSPVKASVAACEAGSSSVAALAGPSDGVAIPSLAGVGEQDGAKDDSVSAMPPPRQRTHPNESRDSAACDECPAASSATHKTCGTVVTKTPTAPADASFDATTDGVEGSRRTSIIRPSTATIPPDSTPTAVPPPPSPVAGAGGSGRGCVSPRARTRATARTRVIKGRTTASTSAQERGRANGSGRIGDGTETAMATARTHHYPKPEAAAFLKRQRRGEAAGSTEGDAGMAWTDTEPDWVRGLPVLARDGSAKSGDERSSGGKGYQGAPVDGTSKFLRKVCEGGKKAKREGVE